MSMLKESAETFICRGLLCYYGQHHMGREEHSEINVASGFYVMFGSGLMLTFILSIYIMQSSRDKLTSFVRETVAESSATVVGVAKVE